MKKFLVVSIIFSLVLFMFTAVAFAHINITIDGTFEPGEWNRYHWFTDNSEGPGTGYDDDPLPIFSGYITHDSENLYLAFNVEDNTPNTNRDFFYVTIDMPPVGEFNDPIDALYWGSFPGNPSFFGESYLTTGTFPWDRSQRASTWGTDGGVLTARTITSTNRYYEIKIPLVAIGATIGDTIGLKIQARAGQYTDALDPQVVNFYPDMPEGITPIRSDTRVEVTGNFYHYTLAPLAKAKGGGPNGIHVRFMTGGHTYDTFWLMTGSGLVHEWRYDDPADSWEGKDVHLVFKPKGKFETAECDSEGLLTSFSWTFNSKAYTELGGDEADLADFLEDGSQYWVCVYNWID